MAFETLREILHLVATQLIAPVLGGLLLMVAGLLLVMGAMAREALRRHRDADAPIHAASRALDAAAAQRGEEPLEARLEWLLQADEARRARMLNGLRLVVRLGPALGLMGTLIPMAMALQGLARGDMPALAGDLVTAFAATVVGLGASVVAYLLAALRERWLRRDLRALAFHADRLLRETA